MSKSEVAEDFPWIIDEENRVLLRRRLEGYETSIDLRPEVAAKILHETKLDAVVVMGWDKGCIHFVLCSADGKRIDSNHTLDLFHDLANVIDQGGVR